MVKPPDLRLCHRTQTHRDRDPSSTCDGPVSIHAVYDSGDVSWSCKRCGWFNGTERRRNWVRHRTREQMPREIKRMLLRICIHRKSGAPNYGSDGAGAELELELPDELANDPGKLYDYYRIWSGSLERSVDDQLARMAAKHPAAAPSPAAVNHAPAVAAVPPAGLEEYGYDQAGRNGAGNGNGNGNGNGYAGRNGGYPPPPSRAAGVARSAESGGAPAATAARPTRSDAPRDGRQLIGWANGHGKYDELKRLAKAWDLGRIVDWSADDVAAAYRELGQDRQQWG